ncbi:MAG: hypothetical protein AAF721_42320, partial [Myxococcota bacterium]
MGARASPSVGRRSIVWAAVMGAGCTAPSGPAVAVTPTAEVERPRAETPAPPLAADPQPPRLVGLGDPGASSSALALAELAGAPVALLADEDEQRLTLIDLDDLEVLASLELPGRPAHVVVAQEGRIYVSVRDRDLVVAVAVGCTPDDLACAPALSLAGRFVTRSEPIAMTLDPTESTLWVSCGRGSALQALAVDPAGAALVVPVAAEPRGVVLSPDGEDAFIAHALGSRMSVVSTSARAVALERSLDWRDDVTIDGMVLANTPRFAVQGHAIALDDERVRTPMVAAYPGEEGTESSGYGAAVEGLDPYFPHEPVLVSMARDGGDARLQTLGSAQPVDAARRSQQRRRYKKGQRPCLLPRSVAMDRRRGHLLVACADLGEVVAYALGDGALGRAAAHRWSIGAGAIAVALDAGRDTAWAWSQFERRLAPIELDGSLSERALVVPAQAEVVAAEGRALFHAPLAFDGRSCAGCHVDGRDDGLTWRSPTGMVATPVLAGRVADAEPFGWHGERPDLVAHMKRTFKRLRADKPDPATLDALAAYLATMPTFDAGADALTTQELRGLAIFNGADTECADCHIDGAGVDGLTHRVGTGRA